MCYELKTPNGGTEAVIDDNCGVSKFYAIAQALAEDLHVKFLNQVDDVDTLDWDFKYKDQLLTLHFNMFAGVSIVPNSTRSNASKEHKAVLEVARFLEKRAF